ncbi:nucleotide exchange factor GrpE [Streptomyces sp. NPDC048172]|uniref:nucleotide exchange factor GrpE n=1 Tax=Streptomyces sp. NPDC048172 TaxID=3365505 RepID=UPI00371F9A98
MSGERGESQARELARQAAAHHARTERLMLGLVEVLDSFDRLLAGAGAGALEEVPAASVRALARQLERALQAEGLEPVGGTGERADPFRHHVVDVRHRPGAAEDEVVEVVRRGYRFEGQLLRPARVVLADGGADSGAEGGAGQKTEPETGRPQEHG